MHLAGAILRSTPNQKWCSFPGGLLWSLYTFLAASASLLLLCVLVSILGFDRPFYKMFLFRTCISHHTCVRGGFLDGRKLRGIFSHTRESHWRIIRGDDASIGPLPPAFQASVLGRCKKFAFVHERSGSCTSNLVDEINSTNFGSYWDPMSTIVS